MDVEQACPVLHLRAVGFEVIDGIDPTKNMLQEAASKGVYRNLISFDLSDPEPMDCGAYDGDYGNRRHWPRSSAA